MKLSAEQIDYLFAFVRKKYVHWYDVQVELVDHLASRIEELCEADKFLSFEKALDKVYAEFGIFGFAKVVQEAEKAVRKKNNRLWWNTIGNQFSWPNIVRSLCIMLSLFLVSTFINIGYIALGLLVASTIYSFIEIYRRRHEHKKFSKLLLTQYVSTYNIGYVGIHGYIFVNFDRVEYQSYTSPQFIYFFLLCCGIILLSFVARLVVSKIISEAESRYPEFFEQQAA